MAQPVISYPGAKWRFYPYMVEYFPTDMEVFIEPFLGGGSVTLSVADDPRFTKLERMIAGDLAPEQWAFWTGVKENPSDVMAIAEKWFRERCPHQIEMRDSGIDGTEMRKYSSGELQIPTGDTTGDVERAINLKQAVELYEEAIKEGVEFWKWAEAVDCSTLSIPERAARIFLVNKISFSGMGDSGSLSKDQFCDFRLDKIEAIAKASPLLKRVEIYNVSFEDTMKYANDNPEHSFIFLDPPYYKQEGSGLYGRNGDTHRGFPHDKFAEVTKNTPCKWFITYDDSVKVRRMFRGKTALGDKCYIVPFTIPGGYTMAGKTAEDALAGEEVFIANYDIKGMNKLDISTL